jgi:hypothetical protein
MNASSALSNPEAVRETPVTTTTAQRSKNAANPVRVFVDKDRLAFFWFLIAVLALGCAIGSPLYLVNKFKQRERVVIVDPAGTYYISPLLDFQEAKQFHAQQSTLAAVALLDRNPKGFDNPELIKQMFLKVAYAKAIKQQGSEEDEFKSKQLHQKVEIAQIDILETRENFVLTQVTGQLIRTGVFEAKAFSEAVPFKLAFKMQRNPDMARNGRFPTAVSNFKYEPSH